MGAEAKAKGWDGPTVAAVGLTGLAATVAYCDGLPPDGAAMVPMPSAEIPIDVEEPSEDAPAVAVAPKAETVQGVDDEALQRALGDFRIIRKVGHGAMGTVFLAEHRVIGSRVAVKFLNPSFASNPQVVEQFRDEARAVNRVGHPGIVRTYDLRFIPPSCYLLLMEYVEGQSLSSLAGAPVPVKQAVPILAQICDALEAAHRVGVVHRDVKPENIFLEERDGRQCVKLLDFGAAWLRNGEAKAEEGGKLVLGTPAYMPPEQWKGEAVDGRADVYAVGVIAYMLATGTQPFAARGRKMRDVFLSHRDETPKDPRELNAQVPGAWAKVILKALAKKPEDRYASAAEMAQALRNVRSRRPRRRRGAQREASVSPTYVANWTEAVKALPPPEPESERSVTSSISVTLDGALWAQSFRACASTYVSAYDAE